MSTSLKQLKQLRLLEDLPTTSTGSVGNTTDQPVGVRIKELPGYRSRNVKSPLSKLRDVVSINKQEV